MVRIKFFERVSTNPDRTRFSERTYETDNAVQAVGDFRDEFPDREKFIIWGIKYVEEDEA